MAEAGPLSSEDLQLLESSPLPSLERHHLRLLAHALRCLQQIAGRRAGALPARQQLQAWLADQPQLTAEPAFQKAFGQQMEKAAKQLEQIAATLARDPLGLELSDLCHWADTQARSRLRPPG